MPGLDPNIPLSGTPAPFNSPFQVLGQVYALRGAQQEQQLRQQQMQANQAIEQERQQQIAKQKKQEQDQETLNALIQANPDRAKLREAIRSQAPEYLDKFDTSMSKLDETAATATKNLADARLANASAGEKVQSYFAGLGAEIDAHGNTAVALKAAGDHAIATFPDSPEVKQRVEQAYQQVLNGTPIETISKGLMALSAPVQKQNLEAPGQQASSAIQQQVAAGTVGGMTPEQQSQAAGRSATLNQSAIRDTAEQAQRTQTNAFEARRLALQEKSLALKGGANVTPEDVAYFVREYQNDPATTEKAMAGNAPLKQAVQKGLVSAGVSLDTLTNQAKTMKETAKSILPQISKVEDLAARIDKAGLMGTVGGRVRNVSSNESWAAGMAGLTPDQRKLVGQFQSESGLLISAIARAHGGARAGGSPQMIEQLKTLLGATNSDLPTYLGKLAGAKEWMQNYADMGTPAASGSTAPTLNVGGFTVKVK
jgi:hypothetical protein